MTTGTFLRLQFRRSIANDHGSIVPELSTDLATWETGAFNRILEIIYPDGTMVEVWRTNNPITTSQAFACLKLVPP